MNKVWDIDRWRTTIVRLLMNVRKPEYIFRPSQVVRRVRRAFGRTPDFSIVNLPWGLPIKVRPSETIGSCVWRLGIYDLCVSESLWRLLDEGEIAVDVGANIGHMTGILAARTGNNGRVFCFEPHPEIFEELKDNIARWEKLKGIANIDAINAAASRENGTATLHMPSIFDCNRGTASLEQGPAGQRDVQSCEVSLLRLDEVIDGSAVGVMKLDVEGHELAVLEGARSLVERRAVRDIIFEEHNTLPTPVTRYLTQAGYKIFYLDVGLLGPKVVPVSSVYRRSRRDAPNFLATADPTRALKRLMQPGWNVLRVRRMAASQ